MSKEKETKESDLNEICLRYGIDENDPLHYVFARITAIEKILAAISEKLTDNTDGAQEMLANAAIQGLRDKMNVSLSIDASKLDYDRLAQSLIKQGVHHVKKEKKG